MTMLLHVQGHFCPFFTTWLKVAQISEIIFIFLHLYGYLSQKPNGGAALWNRRRRSAAVEFVHLSEGE